MAEEKFELETNTIWSFPNRGKWATHDAKYRGNFSPYIAKNIILRYSKEKDVVLDQFVGGGTTLIECKLNNRNAIGIDINPNAVEITKNKLNFNSDNEVDVDIKLGNACSLDLENESIDLICTHPPYADIIKYPPASDRGKARPRSWDRSRDKPLRLCFRRMR